MPVTPRFQVRYIDLLWHQSPFYDNDINYSFQELNSLLLTSPKPVKREVSGGEVKNVQSLETLSAFA